MKSLNLNKLFILHFICLSCSRQIHMEIKEKIFIDYSIALSLVEHLFKSDINENNLKKLTDYMDEFKTIDSILQTQGFKINIKKHIYFYNMLKLSH